MNNSIAAIILTYNEEKHISRCINSLKNICEEIFVIDSFSKDRTVEIAKESGAQVYQNPWKNYATQFNWGLKNCPITTEWIWRIDADEFLEGNLGPAMKKALAECNNEVNGVRPQAYRFYGKASATRGMVSFLPPESMAKRTWGV